jgi:uncharacterized protein (DUF433 family)
MIQAGDGRMTEQQLLERITLNPKVMAGKPVIKGTRLTVEYMLNLYWPMGRRLQRFLKNIKG